jgi:nitroreductase/ferredoxin
MRRYENLGIITIDTMKCTKCGNCITSCPWNIFIQHNEQEYPYTTNEELCVSCGHCMAVCDTKAIQHDNFPTGTIQPVNRDILPASIELRELLRSRRSIRGFLEKPVDKELLETIVDATRFAPSTNNIQSNEWLIVQDKAILETIKKETYSYFQGIIGKLNNPLIRLLYVFSRRPEAKSALANVHDLQKIVIKDNNGRDFFLHNAPVLLVAHSKKTYGFSNVDAHFALHNATLMIQTLGLGCFFAGYVVVACRKNPHLQRLLSIPADHYIHGCLALGYPKISYRNWIEKRPAHVSWR